MKCIICCRNRHKNIHEEDSQFDIFSDYSSVYIEQIKSKNITIADENKNTLPWVVMQCLWIFSTRLQTWVVEIKKILNSWITFVFLSKWHHLTQVHLFLLFVVFNFFIILLHGQIKYKTESTFSISKSILLFIKSLIYQS